MRISVAAAAGAGLVAVAGLAMTVGPVLHTGSGYTLRSMVIFAVIMLAAAGVAGRLHPFPRFGPANWVTTMRVMLVALVAGALFEPVTPIAAWLVVGATIVLTALDGLDGWLARRMRIASRFGAWFDMETDALLILVLSVFVWRYGKAGAWVMACGLMRYAFVASGWILPWMAGPLRPTFRGKTVAVGQYLGLGLALAPVVRTPISDVTAAVTLVALAWSFAIDVGRLRRKEG